ncbi:MAG: DUF4381 domain-containing protein [Pseudomonadales bacterium]
MPKLKPEQDPLAQLRDIHLPDAVSSWPPAPGWWILTIMAIALLAVGLYKLSQWIRSNRYRRQAIKQLAELEQYGANKTEYLQRLNQLLKQTALIGYSKGGYSKSQISNLHASKISATETNATQAKATATHVAGLSGQQWLTFLDRSGNTNDFSQGVGKVLLTGPYSPNAAAVNIAELQTLARQWIKHHDRLLHLTI